MMNIIFLIFSLVGITSIDLGIISMRGGYINRTIKELPLSLIKAAVASELIEEKVESYFYKSELEYLVNSYLKNTLKGKIDSYKISFYYYFVIKGHIFYDSGYEPKNVQIHFVCNFYKKFQINQYLDFKITDLWS